MRQGPGGNRKQIIKDTGRKAESFCRDSRRGICIEGHEDKNVGGQKGK